MSGELLLGAIGLGALALAARAAAAAAPRPATSTTPAPSAPPAPPRSPAATPPPALVPGLALRPPRGRRLTWSTKQENGDASPGSWDLLDQARRAAGDDTVTMQELAAARLVTSEYDSGNVIEWAAIIDAECNRAARDGRTLYQHLTRDHGFGSQGQGSSRPASTARDPYLAHLVAARLVLGGELRGVSRGAHRFFDPTSMDALHRKWKAGQTKITTTCDALGLLEAWSFDFEGTGRGRCPFDRTKPGHSPEAWVGPIPNIDAKKLMLMQPMSLGAEHTARYQAARAFLLAP